MKEKLIAGFMAALMALVTAVYPVLGATALKDFPGFLGKPVEGFYIVIGSAADPSDVAGAVDIAIRLAELSYEEKPLPGVAAAVTGVEKEISIGDTDISNDFPATSLTQVHIPFLKDSTIRVGTVDKRYYEVIDLPDGDISNDYTTFNESVVLDIRTVTTPGLQYRLIFAEAFNFTDGGFGTSKPLELSILGQPFKITSVGANSFVGLTGVTGTAEPNKAVVYGNYMLYSDLGKDNEWARIKITDSAGNPIENLYIDDPDKAGGTSEKEGTIANVTVRVLNVRALQDGTIVGVDLAVSSKGVSPQKTYSSGDDFPGYPDWKFNISITGTAAANISANNYIGVKYSPDLSREKWFKSGEKPLVPNDYFEFKHNGFTVSKYASLTIDKASGVNIYDASNKAITDLSGLSGFVISSDNKVLAGAYEKAYVVFKQDTSSNRTWINATLAYVDPTKDNHAIYSTSKRLVSNSTETDYTAEDVSISVTFDSSSYTLVFESSTVTGTTLYSLAVVPVNMTGYTNSIQGNYTFKNAQFDPKMGATEASVDTKDVQLIGSVMGGTANPDISSQESDIVYDTHGSVVKAVKSNVQSDRMVFSLPADTVKVKVVVGKTGAAVTGQTYKAMVSVTSPVAVMDTEVTATHRTKNFVTVGGPCVNRITAEALNLTYPACGAASTVPENAAMIKIVDNYPATGLKTVVVAGWEKENTRTAATVLQQYDTLLVGQTASAVKVTSATVAGITAL
jgi:hypothetical protein